MRAGVLPGRAACRRFRQSIYPASGMPTLHNRRCSDCESRSPGWAACEWMYGARKRTGSSPVDGPSRGTLIQAGHAGWLWRPRHVGPPRVLMHRFSSLLSERARPSPSRDGSRSATRNRSRLRQSRRRPARLLAASAPDPVQRNPMRPHGVAHRAKRGCLRGDRFPLRRWQRCCQSRLRVLHAPASLPCPPLRRLRPVRRRREGRCAPPKPRPGHRMPPPSWSLECRWRDRH